MEKLPAKKITYLLGAGASAAALPTVKDFPGRLIKFYQEIKERRNWKDVKIEDSRIVDVLVDETSNVLDSLIQVDPKWGVDYASFDITKHKIVNKHASVDTYAKKLSITEQFDKLKSLKSYSLHSFNMNKEKTTSTFVTTIS